MHKDFNGNELFTGQKVIIVTGKYNDFKKRYVHSFTEKKVRLSMGLRTEADITLDPSQIAVYEWKSSSYNC